jgi:hypothetical protein
VSGNPEQAGARQNIGHVIGHGSQVVVTIRPPTIHKESDGKASDGSLIRLQSTVEVR